MKDTGNRATGYSLTFKEGDIAYCPYYNVRGKIVELKKNNGFDYVILLDDKGNKTSTCIKTESANSPFPCYLQMVCTKEDYDVIAERIVFGGKTWGVR